MVLLSTHLPQQLLQCWIANLLYTASTMYPSTRPSIPQPSVGQLPSIFTQPLTNVLNSLNLSVLGPNIPQLSVAQVPSTSTQPQFNVVNPLDPTTVLSHTAPSANLSLLAPTMIPHARPFIPQSPTA